MKKKILATIIALGLLGVGVTTEGKTFNNIDNTKVNIVLEANNKAIQSGKVINVSSNLRIRQGANTSSTVLGYLYNGETVKINSKSGNWYQVEAKGISGYVSADYISIVGDTQGSTSGTDNNISQETQGKTGQVVNVSSTLRVRQAASTSSAVVGTLKGGDKFPILAQSNGWHKINNSGQVGYVHGDYVKVLSEDTNNSTGNNQGGSSTTENTTEKIGTGKVVNVSSSLRMRSDASTSSSVIGNLYAGNTFEIYGQKNQWYYIKYNGKFGYIHGDYVQKIGENNSAGNLGSTSESNQGKYQTVLNSMKNQLGTPYVYGGSGEIITNSFISSLQSKFPGQRYDVASQYRNGSYRAFDCSGLMQWGFKQAGISIGRTTYDQVNAGKAVSRSNIQPGDLIFYANLSHVGMYVGDGKWIESPRTGSQVRIADVPWGSIGQIRRVL